LPVHGPAARALLQECHNTGPMKTMTTLSLHLSFGVGGRDGSGVVACFDRLLFSCFSCSAPAIHLCSFPVVFGTFPGFARVSAV